MSRTVLGNENVPSQQQQQQQAMKKSCSTDAFNKQQHHRQQQQQSSPKRKGNRNRNNNNNNSNKKSNHPYPRVNFFANEAEQSKKLESVLRDLGLYDSEEGLQKRQETLDDLQDLLNDWATTLLPSTTDAPKEEDSPPLHVALISFGSYRLGVHKPGADMDLLALCPSHCSRSAFFSSLIQKLERDDRIDHVHPIPEAYTPVVKFTMNGIDIDMLFARRSSTNDDDKLRLHHTHNNKTKSSPSSLYMIDDDDLRNLDEASVRSLNGARVAQVLMETVPNMETYRTTLRAVKEWAHVHGLYSNVLGFLGGINYALLVACVCKRNPKAQPPTLLKAFFQTFSNWNWPMPVTLTQVSYHPPSDGIARLPVWSAKQNVRDRAHLMPILTPSYPSMNSSYNVGIPQLRRIMYCLHHAAGIVRDIEAGNSGATWKDLYKGEQEFFQRHAVFLQINTLSPKNDDGKKWFRFVESRLRLLIAGLENPDYGVQAEPYCQFYTNDDNDAQKSETTTTTFFIALRFQHAVLDLAPLVREFLYKVHAWEGRREGMHVCLEIRKNVMPTEFLKEKKTATTDSTEATTSTNTEEQTASVDETTATTSVEATATTTSVEATAVEATATTSDTTAVEATSASTTVTQSATSTTTPVETTTAPQEDDTNMEQPAAAAAQPPSKEPISWAMKVRGAMASPAKRART